MIAVADIALCAPSTALKHGAKVRDPRASVEAWDINRDTLLQKRVDKQAKQADTAEKKKDRIKQKGAARLAAQTVRIGKL